MNSIISLPRRTKTYFQAFKHDYILSNIKRHACDWCICFKKNYSYSSRLEKLTLLLLGFNQSPETRRTKTRPILVGRYKACNIMFCTYSTNQHGRRDVTWNPAIVWRNRWLDFKVHVTSMGILNICNLWIILRKIVIYLVGRKCHLHGLFCC